MPTGQYLPVEQAGQLCQGHRGWHGELRRTQPQAAVLALRHVASDVYSDGSHNILERIKWNNAFNFFTDERNKRKKRKKAAVQQNNHASFTDIAL